MTLCSLDEDAVWTRTRRRTKRAATPWQSPSSLGRGSQMSDCIGRGNFTIHLTHQNLALLTARGPDGPRQKTANALGVGRGKSKDTHVVLAYASLFNLVASPFFSALVTLYFPRAISLLLRGPATQRRLADGALKM